MPSLDTLLEAIPGAAPAGPDLAYDPAFHALEIALRGRPERQMGSEILAGEPPDWALIEGQCAALLGRAKDLRVAVAWTRARTGLAGIDGLAEGCELVDALLREYWHGAHPGLDADDGDATMRGNALAALADPTGLVDAVRRAPLLPGNAVGQCSQRDLDIASGRLVPVAGAAATEPSQSLIDAAVEASSGEGLLAQLDAASRAHAAAASLSSRLETELGAMNAPDLAPLLLAIAQLRSSLSGWVERRGLALPEVAITDVDEAARDEHPGAADRRAVSGEIVSREDVVKALDRICEYYARFEPSSPVPLLLERAKGLVSKDFLAILADLSPATLEQVTSLARPPTTEE